MIFVPNRIIHFYKPQQFDQKTLDGVVCRNDAQRTPLERLGKNTQFADASIVFSLS